MATADDDICVGQTVELPGDRRGTVMFVGETTFGPGIWVGLEMEGKIGNHDGFVGGKRYFRCRPGHGLYVHREGVVPVVPSRNPLASSSGGTAVTRGDVVIEDSTEDEGGEEEEDEDFGEDEEHFTESAESSSAGVREELLEELTILEAQNRQLRTSARELRSAHARAQRLEAEIASLEQQLGQTVPILATAAVSENMELRQRMADLKESTAVAITEMVEAKIKFAAISGAADAEEDDEGKGFGSLWGVSRGQGILHSIAKRLPGVIKGGGSRMVSSTKGRNEIVRKGVGLQGCEKREHGEGEQGARAGVSGSAGMSALGSLLAGGVCVDHRKVPKGSSSGTPAEEKTLSNLLGRRGNRTGDSEGENNDDVRHELQNLFHDDGSVVVGVGELPGGAEGHGHGDEGGAGRRTAAAAGAGAGADVGGDIDVSTPKRGEAAAEATGANESGSWARDHRESESFWRQKVASPFSFSGLGLAEASEKARNLLPSLANPSSSSLGWSGLSTASSDHKSQMSNIGLAVAGVKGAVMGDSLSTSQEGGGRRIGQMEEEEEELGDDAAVAGRLPSRPNGSEGIDEKIYFATGRRVGRGGVGAQGVEGIGDDDDGEGGEDDGEGGEDEFTLWTERSTGQGLQTEDIMTSHLDDEPEAMALRFGYLSKLVPGAAGGLSLRPGSSSSADADATMYSDAVSPWSAAQKQAPEWVVSRKGSSESLSSASIDPGSSERTQASAELLGPPTPPAATAGGSWDDRDGTRLESSEKKERKDEACVLPTPVFTISRMRVAAAGGSDVADGSSPAVVRGGKVCLETLDTVCKRPDGDASKPRAAGEPKVLQVVSHPRPTEGRHRGVDGNGGKRDVTGVGGCEESAMLGGGECGAGPTNDACTVELDSAASVDEQKTMDVVGKNAARSSSGTSREKNQIIRKGFSGSMPLPRGRLGCGDLEVKEVEGDGGGKNGLAEASGDGQGLAVHEGGGGEEILSVDMGQVGDAKSASDDDASVEAGALITERGAESHSYAISTPPTVRVSGWDSNTGGLTPDTKFLVGQGKLRRGSAVMGSSFKQVEIGSVVVTPRSVGAGEEEGIGLSTGRDSGGGGVREEEGREAQEELCGGEGVGREAFTAEDSEQDHSGPRNAHHHTSVNGGEESIYGEPETPPSSDDMGMDVDLAAARSPPSHAGMGGDGDWVEQDGRLDSGRNVEIEVRVLLTGVQQEDYDKDEGMQEATSRAVLGACGDSRLDSCSSMVGDGYDGTVVRAFLSRPEKHVMGLLNSVSTESLMRGFELGERGLGIELLAAVVQQDSDEGSDGDY